MAKGLRLPVGVNKSGRASIETDTVEQNKKILFLALGVSDDKNDFQTVGIANDLIFQLQNPVFRARAVKKIEGVFAKFPDRFRIDPTSVITMEEIDESEIELRISYIDLSVNKPEELVKRFSK